MVCIKCWAKQLELVPLTIKIRVVIDEPVEVQDSKQNQSIIIEEFENIA